MKLFLSSVPKVHNWTSQEKLDILTDSPLWKQQGMDYEHVNERKFMKAVSP